MNRMKKYIRASQISAAAAVFGLCWTAAAQPNPNMKQIKLGNNEVPGYSIFYEGERDWSLFTADTGAPAPCLQSKALAPGIEQVWRRSGSASNPNQGMRVDYAVFESAGEAASAANAAALLSNNATAKLGGEQTVGDAAWRTIAGSPALIIQRGPAVIYLSAQRDGSLSESDLATVAGKIIQRIDAIQMKLTPGKLACDIETYLGLNLIQSQKERLKSIARDLAGGSAPSRRALAELKSIVGTGIAKGMDREAAVNLLRATSSLADQ